MAIESNEKLIFLFQNQTWRPVACVISHSFSETTEMFDTTTRQNGKWKTSKPDLQSYNLSIEGLAETNGLSLRVLTALKRDRIKTQWGIGSSYLDIEETGKGYITSISFSDETNGYRTFNLEIEGFGEPESLINALGIG